MIDRYIVGVGSPRFVILILEVSGTYFALILLYLDGALIGKFSRRNFKRQIFLTEF